MNDVKLKQERETGRLESNRNSRIVDVSERNARYVVSPRRSTYAGFVSGRCTVVYHPPAGKQLPTSCLGRFLHPAFSPWSFFLLSLSSRCSLPFSTQRLVACLPLAAGRVAAGSCRPVGDAIRGPESVGPRWWTGAFWSCCAFVARALRPPSSRLPPPPLLSPFRPSPIKSKRREILYCRV